MVPGLRAPFETAPPPKNGARRLILGVGLAATAVALIAGLFALSSALQPPPQPPSTIEVAAPQAPLAAAPEAEVSVPAEPGAPSVWRVDAGASSIGFGYTYTDESGEARFNGQFTRWRADIRFDAENLAASRANVTIETGSATTGVGAHDAALPTRAWFNSAAFPTARFVTRTIRRSGDGYVAEGDLTIRDRTRPVALPFSLSIAGDRAVMTARLSIDRRDFDVGDDADGDDLISREIDLTIRVEATRAP